MMLLQRFQSRVAVADLPHIRGQFPALHRRHRGEPVAYFDGPGGTQVPAVVVRAITEYLEHHNANTHWRYPTSIETDGAIAAAREALADFLNASASEIVFGPNMTSLTFHLGRALGRSWGSGDEIIVTELDHHANVAPWQALARERGVVVRTAQMHADSGQLDWDHLASLLTSRTKLLAIGAASNALGTVTDVRVAVQLARAAGALIFVDAVHYAPHMLVDVRTLDCDFLTCSPYKFYGPHLGVLYGKAELLQSLDAPKLVPAPDSAPERLETGTQNHEGIVGAAAAVDFLASLTGSGSRRHRLQHVYEALHGRGQRLLERLWRGLRAIEGVRLFGPAPDQPRTPTVAFRVQGCSAAEVAESLAKLALFVSHGDFYATTAVERLGQAEHGLVRAGCACYTTEDEVDRLIEGVRMLSAEC